MTTKEQLRQDLECLFFHKDRSVSSMSVNIYSPTATLIEDILDLIEREIGERDRKLKIAEEAIEDGIQAMIAYSYDVGEQFDAKLEKARDSLSQIRQ